MNRSLIRTAGALLVLLLPAVAPAMVVIDQFPSFASHLVLTEDAVTVVFDQSLFRASVTDDSFYVTRVDDAEHVDGTIAFADTNQADDTAIFTPAAHWN
jgi:hypothetical protein